MPKISDSKKKKLGITVFDPVNYLNNENDIADYFEDISKEDGCNALLINQALNYIARARLLIDLSKKTGISLDKQG